MAQLIPLTKEARYSIKAEKLVMEHFPFRFGRESRHSTDNVSAEIMERRTGKVPPNNDCYLIDDAHRLNISREHFLIEQNEQGEFKLFDRMSSCGTIVRSKNGTETFCTAHRCNLSDGDIIIVGTSSSPYIFKFSITN